MWLRENLLRFWGRFAAPEAQPPAYTAEQIIAARDAAWQAKLAHYDVRPKDDRPRKFSPLLIDNEARKCFRMKRVNGARVRVPVDCDGGGGDG